MLTILGIIASFLAFMFALAVLIGIRAWKGDEYVWGRKDTYALMRMAAGFFVSVILVVVFL